MENNYIVYGLLKKIDGTLFQRIFYVGITKSYRKRISLHGAKSHENDNPQKVRIMNKYGWEPIKLWQNLSKEEAKEREIFLIKYFGKRDRNQIGQLTNITDGGDNISDKVKRKIDKYSKPFKEELISNYLKSTLSQEMFCEENKINVDILRRILKENNIKRFGKYGYIIYKNYKEPKYE